MNVPFILVITLLLLITGSVVFGIVLRRKYLEYDRKETLKDEISQMKVNVDGAMEYFRTTYCNDFDHTVYETIRIKVNFLKNLIDHIGNLDRRKKCYELLYKRLYETGYRLKTDFNNVTSVIMPLNSLRDELVNEKIDYLRRVSEDGDEV